MVERHLRQNGLSARCSRVDSLEGVKEAIEMESWDLVLSDYNVPQLNIHDSLNLILTALPDLAVILVTGTVGEEKAVQLLKLGGEFFLQEMLTDVTERKQAEENLRKLYVAVEQSPTATVITDVSGRIEYVNPRFTILSGYSFEEVLNKNPRIPSWRIAGGYARDIFAEGNELDGNSIFIQKPISPNDLVAKVRELLDKK